MNSLAGLAMLLGYGLIFWGLRDMKGYRSNPPAASPGDICTFHGQSMPCGSLPNNGAGFYDGAGHPARQAQENPGLFQGGLSVLVMTSGLIFAATSGSNLRRIRNAVTDYTHEQMQAGSVRCRHCGFVNQGNNRLCGRCGKPLAH